MRYNYLFLVFAFLLSANVCSSQATFSKNAFLNPPNSVKVHAWWHWVDDAITKEGITKDLESMKKGGISQATILNVSLFDQKDFGVPQIKFNTPEWYRMFQWSLKEANRLGITLGAHNCDGWSSSGGPWSTSTPSSGSTPTTPTGNTCRRRCRSTLPTSKPPSDPPPQRSPWRHRRPTTATSSCGSGPRSTCGP